MSCDLSPLFSSPILTLLLSFLRCQPSASSLITIYQTFLDGHLTSQNFNSSISSISSNLIKGALAVHKEVP